VFLRESKHKGVTGEIITQLRLAESV